MAAAVAGEGSALGGRTIASVLRVWEAAYVKCRWSDVAQKLVTAGCPGWAVVTGVYEL